ncbi:syntaxin-binding protein 4-like [Mytilus galloprovincialis]|uniref:syntaxin-binding protein 4-like n=1 Tax=Mytilus galloprovincialis TaxID=29158 RepID=UPI003F7BA96B
MSTTVCLTQVLDKEELLNGLSLHFSNDEDEVSRAAEEIEFDDCSKGLGIKICGGCSLDGRQDNGIFVKRVLPGGLADIDGRLQAGDHVLRVNDESLEGVTNERAVAILRQASATNHVVMVICRDQIARNEFQEILEKQNGYSFPCTPIPNDSQNRSTSRATTPSGYGTDTHRKSPNVDQDSSLSDGKNSPREISGSSSSPRYSSQINGSSSSEEHSKCNGVPKRTHSDPQYRIMIPSMASTPQVKGSVGSRPRDSLCSVSSMLPPEDISPVPGVRPLHGLSNSDASSVFTHQSHSRLPKSKDMSQSRKLSLDPHVRLKIDKLEVALQYLGLEPNAEQQSIMRNRLHVDSSGTVNYGDFVVIAKEVFRHELEERNITTGAMLFAASDLTDLVDPPPFRPEMSNITDIPEKEDIESLRLERDQLRDEVQRLKNALSEKDHYQSVAEGELARIKKRAIGAVDETRSLRDKVQLAEQAQRAARSMEQDYEEVVQLLEKEIAKLKQQLRFQGEVNPATQQKIAVLTCQLRKSEAGRKTYEVATEKLLQFAENVHEIMTGGSNVLSIRQQGEVARGNKPPAYLSKHKKLSPKTIAAEAKEVVCAVRSIIEAEPLPYGWEEAYTADGMKYYLNHSTQITTWSHPRSGVQQFATIQVNKNKEEQTELKHTAS